MRRLILTTASVIALGIAGAGPIYAAGDNMTNPAPTDPSTAAPASGAMAPATGAATGAAPSSMPQAGASQPATPSPNGNANPGQPDMTGAAPAGAGAAMSRSEIRQAQQQLRQDHLYRGRIDGIAGSATRQAVQRYQRKNGLPVTAQLDQDTMNSLLGNGQGSSAPPATPGGMAPANGAGSPGSNTMPNAGANPPSPGGAMPNTGK